MNLAATFFSVVPSPYQRDLFRALARHPQIRLQVFYQEAAVPGSPWPQEPLAPYERILPGGGFHLGRARCQVNWPLPSLRDSDVVVCNTMLTSPTGQWLMRVALRRQPWLFWGERITRRGGWYDRLTTPLHRATGIAAIGRRAGREYRERFPEPRHFAIPYYCDLAPFLAAPRRARTDGNVVFLLCGQMVARKGIDLLLTAFMQLDDRARLLLVGREGELPVWLGQLPARVRARIEYAGFQAPGNLPQFFAQADVFVLPSRYDGWGVVVNQALGAGLPIVCSDQVGAAEDLVDEEVNGLKFRAGNGHELMTRMNRFLQEPAIIAEWGAASRRKAHEWTPEVGAAKWVDAFQTVLAK